MMNTQGAGNRNGGRFFDVSCYGALGDGRALDTVSVQKAVDACHKAGGGEVFFPAGRFICGTIVLRSGVALYLSPGAVLAGSREPSDYKMKHLLFAKDAEQIGLAGPGIIDGQDDAFLEKDESLGCGVKPGPWRPSPLITLVNCRRVRVESVCIKSAPAWTLHTKNCENVMIRGIYILNNLNTPNSDGIDIDSSRNVIISDCRIESGDDCIVLKATRAPHRDAGINCGEEEPAGPTENVAVTNCVLVSSTTALKLGTESHGDFRHCVFSNCVIRNSRTGIGLLGKDGGTMEGIHFSNIVMTTAPKWGRGVEWPVAIDSEKRQDWSGLSKIRDVSLSDITIHTRGRIIAQGQPGAELDGLSLRNVTMRILGFEEVEKASKLSIGAHSDDNRIDLGNRPAAMIFGYARRLELKNVNIIWPENIKAPPRHAVYGEALEEADLSGLKGGTCGGEPERIMLAGPQRLNKKCC